MPIFIDVFHEFYGTAIVPTFIDIVPFLINIVPTYNLFLIFNEIASVTRPNKVVLAHPKISWRMFCVKFASGGAPDSIAKTSWPPRAYQVWEDMG